jgi:hypothetical protein
VESRRPAPRARRQVGNDQRVAVHDRLHRQDGVPDRVVPNRCSTDGTNSNVFRVRTRRQTISSGATSRVADGARTGRRRGVSRRGSKPYRD